ncbi:MAG TPA: hypothetical protein VFD36_29435 [Kofleriaceae bacterium]|nr:hypothetical protein [Kofleriaceae bacterium]
MRAAILALALAGCGADEQYDPTGTWSFTITWSSGDCVVPRTEPDLFLVASVGDDYLIESSRDGETVTGRIVTEAERAVLSAMFTNPDALGDGGSTTAARTVDASAVSTRAITGMIHLSIAGRANCEHDGYLQGVITP